MSTQTPTEENPISLDELLGEESTEIKMEPQEYHRQREFGPQYQLQKEEPQHRAICILAVEGYTQKEIAEKLGFSAAMVAYVKKQAWAQKFMLELQTQAGANAVRRVLQEGALGCAKALIEIAHNPDAKNSDRIAAASQTLDRLFGKAPQLVANQNADPTELSNADLVRLIQST